MKNIPNLSLRQVYPRAVGGFNLNTCHDPDCGNFDVGADFLLRQMAGVAPANAGVGSNSGAVGLGRYKLDGTRGDKYRRVSTVFEYRRHPRKWLDRKILECQYDGGSGPCGTHFELQSNEHLVDEIERLRGCNGVFQGPACRACGRDYLDAPEEFTLDGAELGGAARRASGKSKKPGSGHGADAAAGPDRVRLIHKACRGRPGSRIRATLDHRRQRRSSDNVAILGARERERHH